MRAPYIDWTPLQVATLISLWSDGLSASEIGRHIGIGKNAVVGKAHRLKLASRRSPIKRPPPKQRLITLENIEPDQCRWPEGDPKDEDFHFCGAPIVAGKPYCQIHCNRAYEKPREPTQ